MFNLPVEDEKGSSIHMLLPKLRTILVILFILPQTKAPEITSKLDYKTTCSMSPGDIIPS